MIWLNYQTGKKITNDSANSSGNGAIPLSQQRMQNEEEYWIYVNKAEAYFGLGEMDEYQKADEMARALNPTPWLLKGYEGQLDDLKKLLLQFGNLLSPPWKGLNEVS